MMPNPVTWFEIYVQDLPRAKVFYEAVFQTTLTPLTNPMTDSNLELWSFPMSMEGLGAGGALVRMEGKSSGVGGTLVYFGCADCAVTSARVEESGGKVLREKFSIGSHGFIAIVHDTEGNLIGLHSMV
jgi:predicted enzyme related to lactoylglutathione lyase